MNTMLLRGIIIAAAACLPAAALADHMSPWGEGWANMPNDIHNTRLDLRDDNDAFRDFIQYGEGADTTNRFLTEETAAVEAALDSGHQVVRLSARLDPLPDFLGGGWARYTAFDDDTLVSRVLNINVRLRLIQQNGDPANETLGLTADNAGDAFVNAYFREYNDTTGYALCSLVFDDVIDTDGDEVADYAVYSLSLKEDAAGLIDDTGTGECHMQDVSMLPSVKDTDVVVIGVLTPAISKEEPVLQGGF